MGYTTDFAGQFRLDRRLEPAHHAYLDQFAEIRHMWRDVAITRTREDPLRVAVGLTVGVDGEYFVGEVGFRGMGRSTKSADGILSYNDSPQTQPGLWCGWKPSQCGNYIEWDGKEKFYNYVDWLQYIIDNFLVRWGYTLNGEVAYQGESEEDFGKLFVFNNRITKAPSPLEHIAMAADNNWTSADLDALRKREWGYE